MDGTYRLFKGLLTQVCDKHCPFVTFKRVRKSEEITEDIEMKHLKKKAHTKGLKLFWQMFRHFRNDISNYF